MTYSVVGLRLARCCDLLGGWTEVGAVRFVQQLFFNLIDALNGARQLAVLPRVAASG